MNNKGFFEKVLKQLQIFIIPVLAGVLALIIGGLIILTQKQNPIIAYQALFKGSFGSIASLGATINRMIPLIFTGLCVAVAYKSGTFNIGAEGQLILGGIFGTLAGTVFSNMPSGLHILICILASALGGALWAFLPAVLKAWRGINEVITTLMMNYIGFQLLHYLLRGPMIADPLAVPASKFIADSAKMPIIWKEADVSLAAIVALICVFLIYFLMFKTTLGFKLRAVGANPRAANYSGIQISKTIITGMLISGAMAGIAGGVEVMSNQYRLWDTLLKGYGFDGITVALVGQLHPFGVLITGLFFGALRAGGNTMQVLVKVPVTLVYVIQALTILLVVGGTSIRIKPFKFEFLRRLKEAEKDIPLQSVN